MWIKLVKHFRLTHLGLTAEGLREVEQKDIQVRLQELFRDRKLELENTLKNMETHYDHILKARRILLGPQKQEKINCGKYNFSVALAPKRVHL